MGNTASCARRCPADQRRDRIRHSEINESDAEPVHLLQIWIMPDRKNVPPAYAEKSFAQVGPGQLHLIASKTGATGRLRSTRTPIFTLPNCRRAGMCGMSSRRRNGWLQVIVGELEANGHRLTAETQRPSPKPSPDDLRRKTGPFPFLRSQLK